jgi:alpha-L-fucosidase 2
VKRNFLFAAVVSAAASFTFLLVCEAGNAQRSAPPAPLPVNPAVESRTQGPSDPLTLWYRTPSKQWTDALAIGNGRLGAMVYGLPQRERLQLNDITVWSGGPQPDQNRPDAYKALPAIRKALADGDWAAADKLVSQNLTSSTRYNASYETLGNLDLEFTLPEDAVTDYWRWLDIGKAVAGVEFKVGDATYRRESFSSHPDGVIVTRISCTRPGAVGFTLRLSRVAGAKTVAQGSDTLVMTGNTDRPERKLPGNMSYEAQVKVRAKGGSVKAADGAIVVTGANEATVILATGTTYILDYDKNYRGPDPHPAVTRTLAAASAKSYGALLAAHEADYTKLFNRVKFSLPDVAPSPETTDLRIKNYGDGAKDPALAVLYYQMGRYLLIASSREDNPLPTNSQGIWGDGLDMPWMADYKANINYEMFYWPSETANLSELHMPAIRLDASVVKPGIVTAKTYYNSPGWALAYTTNAWGWTAPGGGMPYGAFFGGGGWMMQDLWEHYAFTRDKAYLAKYYPVMKGSAEFFLSNLVEGKDGLLSTSPSLSPENGFVTDTGVKGTVSDNSAAEREIVWDLFTNTIAAEKVLGTDADFRAKLEAAKAKLRPLEIGKAGQLEEWGHDWDLNGDIHHRHVSHLYGAFPGWEISPLHTPELANAVRKSLEMRGDQSTGWSNAWKINLWAHLRDGDHAFKILSSQLQLVATGGTNYSNGGGTYSNMFDAHPPFQIDGNFGSTSGIDEMLVQSSDRYEDAASPNEDRYYIDLLPAVPSVWRTGSIHGLRARGGFAVDVDWKDGRLVSAKVTSVAGTRTRLRYDGKLADLALRPGQSVRVTANDGKLIVTPLRSAGK